VVGRHRRARTGNRFRDAELSRSLSGRRGHTPGRRRRGGGSLLPDPRCGAAAGADAARPGAVAVGTHHFHARHALLHDQPRRPAARCGRDPRSARPLDLSGSRADGLGHGSNKAGRGRSRGRRRIRCGPARNRAPHRGRQQHHRRRHQPVSAARGGHSGEARGARRADEFSGRERRGDPARRRERRCRALLHGHGGGRCRPDARRIGSHHPAWRAGSRNRSLPRHAALGKPADQRLAARQGRCPRIGGCRCCRRWMRRRQPLSAF